MKQILSRGYPSNTVILEESFLEIKTALSNEKDSFGMTVRVFK
jgi:hypothetical protein